MCGIAGVASTGAPDPHLVSAMCEAIVHRGPDSAGSYTGDHACLGMRRLAVIDVAGGGQPVYSEDRAIVAVFNGEIYNFGELRAQLLAAGHRFASVGDSECLVHLYEEHGDDMVHRLRGMFAFAIWDARRCRLLLARDRIGKKPLYWRCDGKSIYFASEVKSLLRDPGLHRRLDPVAMHHYLTLQYVPAPWSIYKGVSKLPPGHTLVWERGRARTRRYWQLDFTPQPVDTKAQAAERLKDLLLDATRVRMLSERPLGAFLSGGIDSSAVVAAMARLGGPPVKTFCVGFDDAAYDERRYARAVAERYGTDHHEMVVRPSALDVLPGLARCFDEPFADSSAIPSYYVARLSRQHVTVVLNGDGGDECFGGYRRYAFIKELGRLRLGVLKHPVDRLGSVIVAHTGPRSAGQNIGRGLQFLAQPVPQRYARLMSYFSPEQKSALYSAETAAELSAVDTYALFDEVGDGSAAVDTVGQLQDVDVNTYLPGDLLVKVDITTMANSLEARSPFLDHHLMQWAAGLPGQFRTRRGKTKYLLKYAMADWLPASVINRPKAGFGVPMAHWLRADLRDLCWQLLTDHTARSRGIFRSDAVRALLDRHAHGHDESCRLWTLMQFELWHRTFLDRPVVATPERLVGADGCPDSCAVSVSEVAGGRSTAAVGG